MMPPDSGGPMAVSEIVMGHNVRTVDIIDGQATKLDQFPIVPF